VRSTSRAGRGGPEARVAKPGLGAHVQSMRTPKDLIAVHVPKDDLGDYNLTQIGWYAMDDGDHVILGPFESLAQCDRAIRDRLQQQKL
jgi:hypothetical protein